jgi:hypothetical protein
LFHLLFVLLVKSTVLLQTKTSETKLSISLLFRLVSLRTVYERHTLFKSSKLNWEGREIRLIVVVDYCIVTNVDNLTGGIDDCVFSLGYAYGHLVGSELNCELLKLGIHSINE